MDPLASRINTPEDVYRSSYRKNPLDPCRQESRVLHPEQFQLSVESCLKDMRRDLESLLRGAGDGTPSESPGGDGGYRDWTSLQRTIDNIQKRLGGNGGGVLGDLATKVSCLEDLVAADDGVMGRLDFLVAMLMAERGEEVDTPRQAVVLPPWTFAQPHGLSVEEQAPGSWTKKLDDWREGGFKAGKGAFQTKMRLFPLCAHSHRLVACGHNGQGYDVQRARKWVRMTVNALDFLLQVACSTLQAVTVAQLPATALGAAAERAVTSALGRLEGGLEGMVFDDHNADIQEDLRQKVGLGVRQRSLPEKNMLGNVLALFLNYSCCRSA